MGYLKDVQSLHLQNNRLSGPLPQSLQNCSSLMTLDLSINSFTGKLPTWIEKFHDSIQFLNLRSNRLEGEIPIELCYLTSLQILDIAENNFSGRIPTCFKNLTAMTFGQRNDLIFWCGNNLCGLPLTRFCGADIPLPPYAVNVQDDEDLNEKDSIWFYLGVPWGFVVGFWYVIGPLLVRRSWRRCTNDKYKSSEVDIPTMEEQWLEQVKVTRPVTLIVRTIGPVHIQYALISTIENFAFQEFYNKRV
ncbi:Leucine-rich repeat [Dillenia turbinata]|uniref:Leucine-rich repeat n=1 Tax=Dillenia turbinata TaxID=194707 RepID=A0AAN8Z5A2_9MAGN